MARSTDAAEPEADTSAAEPDFEFDLDKNPMDEATSAKGPLTLDLDSIIVDRDDITIDGVSYRVKNTGDHSANSQATLRRVLRDILALRDQVESGDLSEAKERAANQQLNALMRETLDICLYDEIPPDVRDSLSDDHLEAIYGFLFARAAKRFQSRVGAIQPRETTDPKPTPRRARKARKPRKPRKRPTTA